MQLSDVAFEIQFQLFPFNRLDNIQMKRNRGSPVKSNNTFHQLQPPQPKRTYSADDLHHTDHHDLRNMFFKDKFDEEEEDSGIKSGASHWLEFDSDCKEKLGVKPEEVGYIKVIIQLHIIQLFYITYLNDFF